MANRYPRSDSTKRPFRIWVAKVGERSTWVRAGRTLNSYLTHRYYQHELNCHRGAWLEAGWAPAGTVLEVIDSRTGKLLGQYRVHPDNRVSFWR